jgi:HK97 family phage major capsid protein
MMATPTESMKEEAQRGLDWRREFGRGGTEVGIARARDIVNGANLSDDTIGRMVSYFARHEVDKDAEGFRPGENGYPSNGRIAWALWGGDPGKAWADREWAKIQGDRSMDEMRPFPNEHAARLKDPAQYDSFARENDAGGDGIDFIYGIKEGASELQAIRFDKDIFTPSEAKQWLADHDFEPILFEEATERVAQENNAELELQEGVTNMDEITDIPERKGESKFTRADAMEVEIKDERRVQMSISSETPVARSFGDEVLVHSPEAIDLSFLNSGRAPLLLDHDPEKQIGVIESVDLDANARKLRANVRFGKSALASEVYGDVADNIRGNVSIGYSINKMVKSSDGRTFRATNWRPMEASIVSIPADVTVGVGRSMEEIASEAEVETPQVVLTETVDEQRNDEPQITETPAEVVTEVRAEVLERKTEMSNDINVAVQSGAYDAPVQQAADIGMSRKEEKSYSLLRAINALANPSDRAAQRAAAFELECSEAAQRAYGQSAQGILVPAEVLRTWGKRDLNTSDDAGLVPQNYRPGDFIDALRNASSVMQAGATMLTGLSGTVKIPKKSAMASAGWFTEGSAASESEMTIGSVTMSPKTAGAYTDISRNMMMGANPSVEALVRQDLADAIGLAIDLGALAGSGSSGQPTGIKNTSGINNPTDFAAANPTWAEVVAMETAVAEDNALRGNLAYILPAGMYGALKTTSKATNQAIFVVDSDGTINGYRAIVSNQVTAGDLYFGNFADLLIGMFGGLDILVDPYTGGTAGTVRVIAMQSVDVAVRNAVSFAFNNDGV